MGANRQELREAVGRALRRLREDWRLSLDDIEQASLNLGLRITRSHLSRVENGQADLALPRFLCLMRAVGEPPAAVIEQLDAMFEQDLGPPQDLLRRGLESLRRAEPATAAALLRQAARRSPELLASAELQAWARAEAALGRWHAAARALQVALAPLTAPAPELQLRLAAATLGAQRPGVALAFARTSAPQQRLWALLIECACLAEAGGAERDGAVDAIHELEAEAPVPLRCLALAMRSELHRRAGQFRTAVRLAERAVGGGANALCAAEARLALARAHGDARRPSAGLRALDQARRLARELGCPDLVARCHWEADRLWKLAGRREAARQALRAARAIWRRSAADDSPPRCLPLHGLFAVDGNLHDAVR